MEPIGAIAEGEWSSLSGMYTIEEADFMAQLLGNCPIPMNELDGRISLANSSAFWGSHESTMNVAGFSYSLNDGNSNSYCFSQGSSGGDSILFPSSSSQESFYLSDSHPNLGTNNNNNSSISLDFCMGDTNNTSSFLIDQDDDHCLNSQEMSSDIGNMENLQSGWKQQPELGFPNKTTLQPKKESAGMQAAPEPATEIKLNNPSENSKKRSRTIEVQKNKRNVKSRKNQKSAAVARTNNEEETNNNNSNNNNNNAGLNRQQPSSNCCSEDESNASQGLNGGESLSMSSKGKAALNLTGKTRASRGSATDPQSLYARKRRERINERLRILQNLVPNGTKVDISTMLEEAVQYVKFLQLQIKLLSSDDLWMYAPIAYNGMNIGLDHLRLTASRLS